MRPYRPFAPDAVWEAVYITEGPLKNTSEVRPTTVHADTQGQSFPVFAGPPSGSGSEIAKSSPTTTPSSRRSRPGRLNREVNQPTPFTGEGRW
ncbi:Tn3 family transposase [Streptomyces sp. NPDC048560]|uniref:Tn3 family transposase n=1 Tax=Streptomyces sp. NPDC048560 TaxID=3155488 RepID=UPI0034439B40